jgi:hypothetical protein
VGRALTLAVARCNGLALSHSVSAWPCQRLLAAAQRAYAVDHHSLDRPCNAAAHGVRNHPCATPSVRTCGPSVRSAVHRTAHCQLGRSPCRARRLGLSSRAKGWSGPFWSASRPSRFGGGL